MGSSTDLRALRQQIIRVATNAGEGHIPSALSILDMVYVLHNSVMTDRCRMILSKGHGCLALYVVLAQRGLIPQSMLDGFCDERESLLGHPERAVHLGIEATTGSLGHGIGMACGMALARKIDGSGDRIFCVIGDGEAEEGSVWESALLASRLELSNLTVLVDSNKSSPNMIDGGLCQTLCDKFRAFGWFVSRTNGHSHESIDIACKAQGGKKPFVVVCDTVKGNGVQDMIYRPGYWHHRSPTAQELPSLLESVQ